MTNRILLSGVQSGLAVVGMAALLTPEAPQIDTATSEPSERSAVLSARVQPLPVPVTPRPVPAQVLIERQIDFHVDLLVDWVVTGVQLSGRILDVPGALLRDVEAGAPLSDAVGRALVEFADVEFDAGRHLIGYAEDWARFQIAFLSDVLAGLPAILSAGPVGELFTASLRLASEFVDAVADAARGVVTTAEHVVHETFEPPMPAVAAAQPTRPVSDGVAESSAGDMIVRNHVDNVDDAARRFAGAADTRAETPSKYEPDSETVSTRGEVTATTDIATDVDGEAADEAESAGEENPREDRKQPDDRKRSDEDRRVDERKQSEERRQGVERTRHDEVQRHDEFRRHDERKQSTDDGDADNAESNRTSGDRD